MLKELGEISGAPGDRKGTAQLEGMKVPSKMAAWVDELLSAPQAAPGAFEVLHGSDDLRHDAELLLLLPPCECPHTLPSRLCAQPVRAS